MAKESAFGGTEQPPGKIRCRPRASSLHSYAPEEVQRWQGVTEKQERAFSPMSKRRRGFPSETQVKRGDRVVHGDKELIREARSPRPMPVQLR